MSTSVDDIAKFGFWNEDCITGAARVPDSSVDLIICDPPFGIKESGFKNIYRREWDVAADCIVPGYVEAPHDYFEFTKSWLSEAKRVLKPDGTIYIISGWTHLGKVLRAVSDLGLHELNHCIWKYNFGVYASRKFVSSHYHVLRLGKSKKVKFNVHSRFGPQERCSSRGHSLLFNDLEDVFIINKEYRPGEIKNKNKLPDALLEKLILYSSSEGDIIYDFFLGNFTTAYVGLRLGRRVFGFELNKLIYEHHVFKILEVGFGSGLDGLKKIEVIKPTNAGKPISPEDKAAILEQFYALISSGVTKKAAIKEVGDRFGRGYFSLINIIKQDATQQAPGFGS